LLYCIATLSYGPKLIECDAHYEQHSTYDDTETELDGGCRQTTYCITATDYATTGETDKATGVEWSMQLVDMIALTTADPVQIKSKSGPLQYQIWSGGLSKLC